MKNTEELDERTVFILVREPISNPQVCLFYQANYISIFSFTFFLLEKS